MDKVDFTQVITHPLGLVGFALSLVFIVLRKPGAIPVPTWWPITAMLLAAVTLLGGLTLSFFQIQPKTDPGTIGAEIHNSDCSQAFKGVTVGGDLSIKCNDGPKPDKE